MEQIGSQRLADIACGDATAERAEVMHLACREKRWRRIETLLRRHNTPGCEPGKHALVATCIRILEEGNGDASERG